MARKVGDRQAKLQNVLLQCQEFQVSFDDFLDKLDDLDTKVASPDPISAILDCVKAKKQENEEIQDAIRQQQPVFEKLLKAGEAVLENLDDEQEKKALEKKISDMKTRFEDANEKTDERQNKLEKVEEEAQKYRDEIELLFEMLGKAEEQVKEFEPLSSDREKLAKQRDLLHKIQDAADKLQSGVPGAQDNADALLNDAETDKNVVEEEVDHLVERIENLKAVLDEREEKLAEVQQAAEDYHVTVAQVEDVFASVYDDVDAPAIFGVDSDKAAEHLEKIKVSFT